MTVDPYANLTGKKVRKPRILSMHQKLGIGALNGAFEGAGRSHPRQDWVPALRSADADLFPDLALGRARSRDIARNGLGKGNLKTLVNHVIGHRGLWPQSRLSAELFGGNEELAREAERQIEKVIKRKSKRMDTEGRLSRAQLHRLTFASMLESGDVGWHLIPGPDGDPIIELIEADRIATPPTKTTADGVREGVERDARGVPIAYHVAVTHPGDTFATFRQRQLEFARVPRFDQDGRPRFILFMEMARPGQTRGIPEFLGCADRYDDRAQGVKAALYQAVTSSFLGFTVEQDEHVDDEDLTLDDEGNQFEEWQYGTIKKLAPGQRLTTPNISRPGPELANFIQATNGEIGASLGMPVEMVSLDFSKTTWHAARQGGLELSRNVRARQEHFVDCGIRLVDQILIENAVLRGEIPAISPELFYSDAEAFLDSLHYQFPVRGLVNPGEETSSAVKAIDSGLSTLAEECAAKGLDWQDVLEQRKRETDTLKRLGFKPVDAGLAVVLLPDWASESAPKEPMPGQEQAPNDPENDPDGDPEEDANQ